MKSFLRSLSNRIFVRFLLAFQLVVLVSIFSLVVVSLALRQDPAFTRWMLLRENNSILLQIAQDAVRTYSTMSSSGMREYIDATENRIGLRLYLFDENGREVIGQAMPSDLRETMLSQPDRHYSFWESLYLLRTSVTVARPSASALTVVLMNRQETGERIVIPIVRFTLIFLGQAIISLVLTRLLTGPILRLRQVARRWAEGDLTARAHLPGRDEIGELGQDFDIMAASLEEMVTARKQLLADISHELRSPLARLVVAVELARSDRGDSIKWERITREAERMNQLIGELLTLSRAESTGHLETAFSPVNIAELLIEIVADAEFEAQGRHCAIVAEISASVPVLERGDPELLRRAMENVLRNAVRYTVPGSVVRLLLDEESNHLLFSVRDQGPGVPPEALPALFRPFYRVESDRDRASGGVGLGLAITERAVRLHGGTVVAENAEGGGLRVTIRLPKRLPSEKSEQEKGRTHVRNRE